jgi:hypothetical protein
MERDRYPKNWNALSRALKDQVNWICQRCGKQCRKERELLDTVAQRVATPNSEAWQEVMDYPQRFCLTVAHLDQNPSNNESSNLLPLCAPCHLDYDRRFIPQNAYAKRERRGQIPLELGAKSMLFDSPRVFDRLERAEARRPIKISLESLSLKLAELEVERDRLAKAAEFAPGSGWIETGMVKGKSFKQAWWRGNFANGKKTIYIGRVGSPEYGKARSAQQARKQLKKVLRQIEQLKKESDYAVS